MVAGDGSGHVPGPGHVRAEGFALDPSNPLNGGAEFLGNSTGVPIAGSAGLDADLGSQGDKAVGSRNRLLKRGKGLRGNVHLPFITHNVLGMQHASCNSDTAASCTLAHMKLNERIREMRKAAGLSREQATEALGWKGVSRLGNYEQGLREPTLAQLRDLASVFRGSGKSFAWLVEADEEPFTPSQHLGLDAARLAYSIKLVREHYEGDGPPSIAEQKAAEVALLYSTLVQTGSALVDTAMGRTVPKQTSRGDGDAQQQRGRGLKGGGGNRGSKDSQG